MNNLGDREWMLQNSIVNVTDDRSAAPAEHLVGPPDETVIEPNFREKYYWNEAWRYRELLVFLAWRDIVVRYKQSVAGVGWAILRPVLNVMVYTIAFGVFASLPAKGVPYALLVLAAMLPWQFFASVVGDLSGCVLASGSIVGKIYFPRIILPIAAVIPSFVDLAIGFVLLLVALMIYGVWPTWRILLAPLFLIPTTIFSVALGMWSAAMYVRYRDMRFLIPFIIQIGFFLSPVGYLSDLVPPRWLWVYDLNPMVGAIEGFRWATLGPAFGLDRYAIMASMVEGVVFLILAIVYFRAVEREFADIM
jgi:lipopolysaccharide transport system permease protein